MQKSKRTITLSVILSNKYIHELTSSDTSINMRYIIINISIIKVNQLQIVNTDTSNVNYDQSATINDE